MREKLGAIAPIATSDNNGLVRQAFQMFDAFNFECGRRRKELATKVAKQGLAEFPAVEA